MKKSRDKNPKVALLSEARAQKEAAAAEKRGSITMDKRERREVAGFKARQREIDAASAPLNEAVREFLAECQERYGITIGVTHLVDFENCSFETIPEEPKEPETPPAM
jgi:hypothetical protein